MKTISKLHSNVFFFELNKTKFEDSWFTDDCHLTKEGSNEKALQIYAFIESLRL